MKYKTAVFDLDGTLLNTLEDLTAAVNASLCKNNMPERTVEEVRQFVGNGIAKLMERAVPEGANNPSFDRALHDFREHYSRHCNDCTTTYPGISDLLLWMKQQGVRMAVVSNKADFAVKELMPLYFNGVIEVAYGEKEEEGIRKKPAPDMVFRALEELSSSVDEAVYIGDSDVDFATAEAAGMSCIGVSWGFRGRAFLEEKGVQVIVDKPEQLKKYFENENGQKRNA